MNKNLSTNYGLWKSRQLMTEVLRFQFQQVAIREAFYNRLKDVDYDPQQLRLNSRMSVIPVTAARLARQRPVLLKVKKVIAISVSRKIWLEQQPVFIQLSLGGWTVRTKPIVVTGFDLVWENLDITALMPIDRILLDELFIEILTNLNFAKMF